MNTSFIIDTNQVEQIDGMTTEYPYCMHKRDLTDIMIPWHWHEEMELGYMQHGTSKIITLDNEYTIHQGDGFFINSNVLDMKKNATQGKKALEINHIFHPIFLSGHFRSLFESKYIAPIKNNRSISVHIIRRGQPEADQLLDRLIYLTSIQGQPDAEFQTRNILSECWLLLMNDLTRREDPQHTIKAEVQDRLQHMIAYIHQNYKSKISASQIARAADISEREALRTFHRILDMSPVEYLLTYRLNESLRLLSSTELSITEISYSCGFSDSAYFGKAFRKYYGCTPSQYRQTGELTR